MARHRLTQLALTSAQAQAARHQVMAAQRTAVLQMAMLAETPLVAVLAMVLVAVLEMENLLTCPAVPAVVTLARAQLTAAQVVAAQVVAAQATAAQVTADQAIAAVLRTVQHQARWGKQAEAALLPAGPAAAAVRLPWARL